MTMPAFRVDRDSRFIDPDALREYLDRAIKHWRDIRDGNIRDATLQPVAVYYIDAYQSMRVSVFGELLEGGMVS